MLTDRGKLAIAELVFYIPALVLAITIAIRHGFNRRLGWVYLVLLGLIRVIGSIIELVIQKNATAGLYKAAVILSGIGLSPLLLVMVGLVKRVNDGMSGNRGIPARVFHFLNLLNLTGLILAIIGGTQMSGSHSANSSQGHPLTRAAIILFVAVFAILSAITIMRFLPQMRNVLPGEKHILLAVALSIPFFTVRLIYSILTSFGTNPTLFNPITGNVVVQSFMAVLEEFIIVGLYIAAGLLAPGFEQNKVQPWGPIGQAGEGMAGSGQQTTRYDHQSGPHTATNHRWDPEAGIEQPVPSFIPSIAPSAGHAIRS